MCIARELPLNPLRNGEGTFHLREVLDRWTVLTLRRQLLRLRVETESLVRDRERLEQRWLRSADEEDSNERLIDLAVALLAAEMFGSLATAALQGLTTADEFHGASEELSGLLVDSGRGTSTVGDKDRSRNWSAAATKQRVESNSGIGANRASLGTVCDPVGTRYGDVYARCHKQDRTLGISA